jgi:hypothetical protein
MPWDGNGNVTRTNGINSGASTWANDDSDGTRVVFDRHDVHDEDLATALNNCLLKDGTNSPTANLPMNTQKHTGCANGTARNSYATVNQVQDGEVNYAGTSTGSSGTYAATLSPSKSPPLTDGQLLTFVANHTHDLASSTPTLNINSSGAKDILSAQNSVITANKIQIVVPYQDDFFLINFDDI